MNSLPQIPGPGGWEKHEQEVHIAWYTLQAANKRIVIWIIAFFVALVLVGGAWMFRWQTVEMHRPAGAALMINRITGEMRYVQQNEWLAVQETKP